VRVTIGRNGHSSKRRPVRVGVRTLAYLALCAAAAAAALAHFAIDIVGDFALSHDTYDNLPHDSRGLIAGLALVIAAVLARRGLRSCFEIAAANRTRIRQSAPGAAIAIGFVLSVVALTATVVPAMEWLDGRLGGVPVEELADAFGGSIFLGLGTTAVCAAFVALLVYSIASWLIAHRDSIATAIVTLLRRLAGAVRPCSHDLARYLSTPRRRRAPQALRLSKRGPPSGGLYLCHHLYTSTEGDSREFRLQARVASSHCARGSARVCGARRRGTAPHSATR
jgi:hypothetical protein